MNVEQLMSKNVKTCSAYDTLELAARIMWENDCGAVPIVDTDNRPIGMITDRDICMAAYTQGKPLWSMPVSSAASHGVIAVRDSDGLDAAEALMQKHQIRRVPVVDADGKAIGILSMNDLARHAHTGHHRHNGLSADSIIRTFAAVCKPTASHVHAAE